MASEQGSAYAAFMAERLKTERARRGTLETRAATVVTTSAALVSLVFALLALLAGDNRVFLSGGKWFVVLSLALFTLAGLAALNAGLVRRYMVPDDATLKEAISGHWTDSEVSARLACAWMDVETMISLRDGNDVKARWLELALTLQIAATIALACGVSWELSALL